MDEVALRAGLDLMMLQFFSQFKAFFKQRLRCPLFRMCLEQLILYQCRVCLEQLIP
jgi:hypothetical protein